jgi:ATP-binding cassette subfamily F protein 3
MMRAQQQEGRGDTATRRRGEDTADAAAPPGAGAKPQATAKTKRKRRFPYRKVEDLEADIAAGETRLREIERLLASADLYRDGDKVKETTRAFEETKQQLQQLYEHWEEAVELN